MTLAGQTALVTGAASGIGRATAKALSCAGAAVILADQADLAETAQEVTSARAIEVDVADPASVQALFDEIGPLDIAVNAAGILVESPTLEMSVEAYERQMDVNLKGSFLVAQAALKALSERGGGRLILIASELGYLGREGFAAYCASKAGVIALTRSFAREFAPHILVNAVAPGAVRPAPRPGPGPWTRRSGRSGRACLADSTRS